MGLIPVPNRQGQYRVYSVKVASLVHMIRRAQAVGFSLAELKTLVELKAKTNQLCIEEANHLIARKPEKLRNDMNKIMLQGGIPGTESTYVAMCHYHFAAVESLMAAFTPHAATLQNDMQNYTDIEPVIQVNEVLMSR